MLPRAISKTQNGVRFLAINFLFSIARGGYFVVLAWMAIEITGSISSAGQVFAIHHLSVISSSKAVGNMVDRYRKSTVLRFGLSVFSFSMLSLAVSSIWLPHYLFPLMLFFTAAAAVSVVCINATFDCLQQEIFEEENQRIISSIIGGVRQVSLMIGAGASGILLAVCIPALSLSIIGFSPLIALLINLSNKKIRVERRTDIAIKFGDLGSVIRSHLIAPLALITAIGFSVGQMTNALLSSYVKIDLDLDSVYYGLVDASWSIGGISFAYIVYVSLRKNFNLSAYLFLVVMGLVLLFLSFSSSPCLIIVAHILLGGSFVATKTLCDGKIIALVPSSALGRTRASIEAMISITGVVAYLIPTFAEVESARILYMGWGVIVLISPLFIFTLEFFLTRKAISRA